MTNKDQPNTSSNQTFHHHVHQGPNLVTDNNSHHHHSRLLYFLTDPTSLLSMSSRVPYAATNPPPFLFPTPSLMNTRPKPKLTTTNTKPILPIPPTTMTQQQPFAVAAVDDCCNQCCPAIPAENRRAGETTQTESTVVSPIERTNKRGLTEVVSVPPQGTKRARNETTNNTTTSNNRVESNKESNSSEEARCKWSSCVASFNTMEDLTPHLYKTHLNNRQQTNACFWESCTEGALLDGGTSEDLLNHLTSQHLKLLHACRWMNCTERFEAFDKLTIHLSKVHVGSGKSEYRCHWVPCDRDGKLFSQRQKIMRHIQTHTGAKPFQCQICQKHFSEANIMTQHMRTHTGEKPFQCDVCQREFSVSASLTIHKRVHSGEKPFGCKYQGCNKRFAESSNLTKHVNIYTHT